MHAPAGRRRVLAVSLFVLLAVTLAPLSYVSATAAEKPATAPVTRPTTAPVEPATGPATESGSRSAPLAASDLDGVNWAMPGDNFVDAPVVPEGLNESDDYDTVYAKSTSIVEQFGDTIGANTVRLPINTHSVPGTAWGDAYAGAVDAATDAGFNVILSYWEDGASSGGTITDMAAFDAMWDAAVTRWEGNDRVFFEPMNEPHGYAAEDWLEVAATWIADRPSVPKERIIISGTGYNQNVTGACADSRFDGTLLSLHFYTFFYSEELTYEEWLAEFEAGIGDCGSRTVLDEFGAPMDDGRDYNEQDSPDNFVRYIQAATDGVREHGMGAVYWPALGGKHNDRPDYDWYSLYAIEGAGNDPALTLRNLSIVDRLRHAWAI